jgi:hypothetical protein
MLLTEEKPLVIVSVVPTPEEDEVLTPLPAATTGTKD